MNFQMSEQINELATSLAIAQSTMENAKKNSDNPAFRSKYADLAEVLDTVKPALNENGIAVMQFPANFVDGTLEVTTMLTHSSGQWIRETLVIPVAAKTNKNTGSIAYDPQSAGSAITYARRYALAAICGIFQADDDGNSSSFVKDDGTKPDKNSPSKQYNADSKEQKQNEYTYMPEHENQAYSQDLKCCNCGAEINEKVYKYSLDRYKQPLCYKCQQAANKVK